MPRSAELVTARLGADNPDAAKSTATCPTAWMASECTGTLELTPRAASSVIGWIAPTSLLAHMTETSAVEAACAASSARRSSGETTPVTSTGREPPTRHPRCRRATAPDREMAWCSTADTTIRVRAAFSARRAR